MVDINLREIVMARNLPKEECEIIGDLVKVWDEKLSRNFKRLQYYNLKNRLRDLDIAIPPRLKNVETVVGWPEKSVDALAVRSRFDGFTFNGEVDTDIKKYLNDNRFKLKYRQLVNSELIHSCSFVTVSKGTDGELPVILGCYSALNASGVWDKRKDRLKYGLTVVDVKKQFDNCYHPTWVNLYTDSHVWEIFYDGHYWNAVPHEHQLGRPLMEPLCYKPSLDRPFGKSRISRAVMSITDSGVRNALRSEIAAEFFTTPQRYLLGANEEDLGDKWDAYLGSILALTSDGITGEKPTYGQLSQGSMQPHIDYMRSLAARLSGETGIPLNDLGVVSDNPSSAEAIYEAKESLVMDAEDLNDTNGESLKAIGKMIIATIKNKRLDDLTDEENSILPRFKNPAAPSLNARADAIVKLSSSFQWLPETDVALEEAGFSEDQITRMKADKRKAEAKAAIAQALASSNSAHLKESTKETEST